MVIAIPSPTLKQRLARAERLNRWKAQALIAPLVLFLLLVFLVPIVVFTVLLRKHLLRGITFGAVRK